jgi:hypothetical protein
MSNETNFNSNGNYSSNGNCYSNGNYSSDGNCYSDGNCSSNGNYSSIFLVECKGTYNSIFCKGKQGISNELFNVKYTEEFINDFKSKLSEIIGNFLPYGTDYVEKKQKGWLKQINSYVRENYVKYLTNGDKFDDYKAGWAKLENNKKEALINLIKTSNLKNTEEALQLFTEITGLNIEQKTTETIKIGNREYNKEEVENALQNIKSIN